jgi:diguanylate cyclase (GGDEF)-like protein
VARRLWRQLATVSLLVGVAGTSNGYDAEFGPGAPTQLMSPVTLGWFVVGMLYLVWCLLRLPTGAEGNREHLLRFWLDASAVVVGGGLFAWHLAFRHTVWSDPGSPFLPLLLVALVAALAFVKVAMSGFGDLDRPAIRLLALAAVVGGSGAGVTPLLAPGQTQINNAHLCLPLTMVVVAFAADRQRRAAGVRYPAAERRSYSVLPYTAVAAVDTLLVYGSLRHGWDAVVVAVAAVSLTALVVLRQVSALRENAALLSRLDANVADLNRAKAELTHRSDHDVLTDLANRSLFERESRRILRTASSAERLSVALIDLDDFKSINDRLGHSVGDTVLVGVAQRLRECVRPQDVVARLGGDEFGLLLPGLRGADATAVLERVLVALGRPVQAAGHDLLVRASIGLAEAWPGAKPQELLRRADLAMYAAKERGKGRFASYDAELEQHQAADAQFGAELRQALDRGEFFLVYQPIVTLPDGAWKSVETLVRWQHPERGLVPPDTFIATAERTGLIVPLGDWILRTACGQAARWLAEYGADAPGRIGVNVSARQLREPGFAQDVVDALACAGLPPERLMVEVTETAVFEGGVALDTLEALAGLGVGVALDDFGTGHSSLGLLRNCPADTLKLDKSFVDGVGGTTEEAVIASAIIQITDGLHLQAVAEVVETAEQAEQLHRLGYRYAQGYHFDRPLTVQQVDAHLAGQAGEQPEPVGMVLAVARDAGAQSPSLVA